LLNNLYRLPGTTQGMPTERESVMPQTVTLEDFDIDLEIELEIEPKATRVTAQFSEFCSITSSDWVCRNC
jgi:hypothetical protein